MPEEIESQNSGLPACLLLPSSQPTIWLHTEENKIIVKKSIAVLKRFGGTTPRLVRSDHLVTDRPAGQQSLNLNNNFAEFIHISACNSSRSSRRWLLGILEERTM